MVPTHLPAPTLVPTSRRTKRVVITDHAFDSVHLEKSSATSHGAEFFEFACTTEDETREAVRGADVAIVNLAPITESVLEAMAPGARVVRYGVGYDNVDVDAATRLGIVVATTAGYGTGTVADHAAALLLSTLRRVVSYDQTVRDDGWAAPTSVGSIPSLSSLTVGLVGTGRIGLALADRIRGFGFRIIASDPYISAETAAEHGVELVSFDELLTTSDAVSLHLPLTEATAHIINAAALARMPRGAVLVNTARGGLVDSAALAAAVRSEHIAAAGLDVFEQEPLPADSELRSVRGITLTPHVAFFSTESVDNLHRMAVDEMAQALQGLDPINPVNAVNPVNPLGSAASLNSVSPSSPPHPITAI
jgi:D-3-phosphoglycerate dehydrogenase